MGFVKNLRVAYKLLILSVVAVIGMLIIGYSGYSAIKKAQVDMDMYSQSVVKSLGYLSDMRYGTRYSQAMMIIMTTVQDDPNRMQNLEKKFQDGVKFVEDGISQYEKTPGKTPEMKQELDAYKAIPRLAELCITKKVPNFWMLSARISINWQNWKIPALRRSMPKMTLIRKLPSVI